MKQRLQNMVIPMLAALTLIFMACPNIVEDPPIVAVTGITDVPAVCTVGDNLPLSGTVTPPDATNQTIQWTVKEDGTTAAGAQISDGILTTAGAGTVIVTAAIANGTAVGTPYIQDFPITINAGFVRVTGITDVPTVCTMGDNLLLSGTVRPPNATNQTIQWTVKEDGTTAAGAQISDGILTTAGAGTVIVTAAIANGLEIGTPYTHDFPIIINAEFVAVTGIRDVPGEGTAGSSLTLSGTVEPDNARYKDITWTVKNAGTTGASIDGGNTLTTAGAGTVTVTAAITDGKAIGTPYIQDFPITIVEHITPVTPVANITNMPGSRTAGEDLILNGGGQPLWVTPLAATNQTITWTVKDAGTTGASFVEGNILRTSWAGTVIITATIANGLAIGTPYTQDFPITINPSVAVTGITDVPGEWAAGSPLTLSGTVAPDNAPYKDITWTVKNAGTTGAVINDGILRTTGVGTVIITATIANGLAIGTPYTQDFPITIKPFVAITGITDVPTAGTAKENLTLSGTVTPPNVPYKDITWTVKNAGTTGAVINDGILRTAGAGTVIVTAAIANGTGPGVDYTQDFPITIVQPVTGIKGVPAKGVEGNLTLSGQAEPVNATNKTIQWTVKEAGTTGASIDGGNTLRTAGAGTVTVTATIVDGILPGEDYTEDFKITINPVVAVTGITNVPTEGSSLNDGMLTLTGTVEPGDATYKDIKWTVKDAGTTGAAILRNLMAITGPGTVTVTATITDGLGAGKDYTQDFPITIYGIIGIIPVTNIDIWPSEGGSFVGDTDTIKVPKGIACVLIVEVEPRNATNKNISWSKLSGGGSVTSYRGGLRFSGTNQVGTTRIRATITNGLGENEDYVQDFDFLIE